MVYQEYLHMKQDKRNQILDCTLRDGGRIIDCAFRNDQITGIIGRLIQAKIDIIEIGFLRDNAKYDGNSTFFDHIEQAEALIPLNETSEFTLFIDFGMYDVRKLPYYNMGSICGIRYGFTKQNFLQSRENIKREMLMIKEKGYKLYFQGVNTVGYSDKELLDLIDLANEVIPYSFGIVDTYGAMYAEDLDRLFTLVDFNLNSNATIDFHGHNNMQMAFALAQKAVGLCQGRRKLVIDATLDGMGKCAGNLNTELVASYLNQKCRKNYEFDFLLDAIDEYVEVFKHHEVWGYSLPGLMAGIYKSHPNNVIYLTDKFRISTKDIRKMLSLIDEDKRQRYDYENIRNIYKNYFADPLDDGDALEELRQYIGKNEVLLLAAGLSVKTYDESLKEDIKENQPFVISVNFVSKYSNFVFWGNDRRYQKYDVVSLPQDIKVIITSNVTQRKGNEITFNYIDCIAETGNYFDNSSIMLLNLLQRIDVKRIKIAGMDGFSNDKANYFNDEDIDKRCAGQFEEINRELEGHLYRFAERNRDKIDIQFITPSRYENAIKIK